MDNTHTLVCRKADVITTLVIADDGTVHYELFREIDGRYRPLQWGRALVDEVGGIAFPGDKVSRRTMLGVSDLLARILAGEEIPRINSIPAGDGFFRVPLTALGPMVRGGKWYDLRPLTLKQR